VLDRRRLSQPVATAVADSILLPAAREECNKLQMSWWQFFREFPDKNITTRRQIFCSVDDLLPGTLTLGNKDID